MNAAINERRILMRWICSDSKAYWQEREVKKASILHVDLQTGEERQAIWGFGACFSELTDVSLSFISRGDQQTILRSLFSPDECNLRFCRLPVGANDFAVSWHTPDDWHNDWDLAHFTLEEDREHLIPLIHAAQRYSKDLELFASPWSPPVWMKHPCVYNYGELCPDYQTMDTYARYLAMFVKSYRDEGISIQRICPQNEVFSSQKFPSCIWSGAQMRDFIRDHLGPIFSKEVPDTEIWLGTVNGPYSDYVNNGWERNNFNTFIPVILKDDQAKSYIKGIALQWGGKHILQHLRCAYPDIPIIQSECECGDGRNAPDDLFYIFELMWLYFQAGARAFTYWNIALDETASSTWGWKQNSLLTVNRQDKTWHFNPEYYIMRHLSHFVCKESKLVTLKGEWAANALAFLRPDGQYVFEMINPFYEEETLYVGCPHGNVECVLPPRSLSTFLV